MLQTEHAPALAARLGAYATDLRFADLDSRTVQQTSHVVLDTIATAIGGYRRPLGRKIADYAVRAMPGTGATILVDGRKATVPGASWASAAIAKHAGMEDSHRVCGHIACEVVPAAFAVGQSQHINGRDFVRALVVGYDVFAVLQPAVKAYQRRKGLDHKSQVGTIASAATAAICLGLDAGGVTNAMALAADMACGTEQYAYDANLSDMEDLLAGFGAMNGVSAALMAADGFRGAPRALDGPYGYLNAFGDGIEPNLGFLGRVHAIGETAFKPHAGCRHVHPCVDAVGAMCDEEAVAPEAVTAIDIGTYSYALSPEFRVNSAPENSGEAAFSIQTAAAVTLVRGSFYWDDIESYRDPAIQRLIPLTTVHVDPRIDSVHPAKNGCEVRVTLRDGRQRTGRVDYARGEPENMLSDAEFAEKLHHLASGLFSEHQLARVISATESLAECEDIGAVIDMTMPEPDGQTPGNR